LNRPLFGFKSINWSRRRVFGWCSNWWSSRIFWRS
jgi:hypothetical protein